MAENRTRWGPHHEECKVCGTTEQPHHARGMCRRCYNRAEHRAIMDDPERQKKRQHEWRKAGRRKYRRKKLRERAEQTP